MEILPSHKIIVRAVIIVLCTLSCIFTGCKKHTGVITEQIQPGIYRIKASRSNVYVLADKTLTLIDTGMQGDGEEIIKAIRAIGRKPEEVTQILITHAHIDHTGSLAFLKQATGAQIFAGIREIDYIQGAKKTWRMEREGLGGTLFKLALFVAETFFYSYTPVAVDVPLLGGEVLNCFEGIKVVATPGHSPGSLSYYLPEKKILFTGDALSGAPEVRLPPQAGCADYQEARASVKKLSALRFETCCFGHGEPLKSGADAVVKKLCAALP